MGFPRQEYWSELSFSSPGDLPDPGMEPASPDWQADSLLLSHLGSPYLYYITYICICICTLLEEVCQFCDSDLDLNDMSKLHHLAQNPILVRPDTY